MILHPTTAFIKKLKVELGPDDPADPLFAWRVNYVEEPGHPFVVFMNELTQFAVVIDDATTAVLRNLPDRFREVLAATLRRFSVNPAVIERYIADLGEFAYARNTDKTMTARLNHTVRDLWWGRDGSADSVELSRWSNRRLLGVTRSTNGFYPHEVMLDALGRYGLPVRRTTAFDLTVRLDLVGQDAVRRLRVPASWTFEELHAALQAAYDWKNYHLHSFGLFREWGEYYARPEIELITGRQEDWPVTPDVTTLPVEGVALSDYVPRFTKILYTYDFGDDWHHYIEVDAVIDDCEETLPILLSGEGDAPREDVGGPGGWANFLEVTSDPGNPDYEWLTEWASGQWWSPFDFNRTALRIANMG